MGINWATAEAVAVPITIVNKAGLKYSWCAGLKKFYGTPPYLLGDDGGPNVYASIEAALDAAKDFVKSAAIADPNEGNMEEGRSLLAKMGYEIGALSEEDAGKVLFFIASDLSGPRSDVEQLIASLSPTQKGSER
jgi:hypothetical protein